MAVTEAQLSLWAQGPGQTEQANCDRSVEIVTEALRADYGARLKVFAQGSYKNRTNVRVESDVDIAVVDARSRFMDFPGVAPEIEREVRRSMMPSDWNFGQFKDAIETRLIARFGRQRVSRGNKCINIASVVGGITADVVPAFLHCRYGSSGTIIQEGIQFVSDRGEPHFSFPEQHFRNGLAKHERTRRQYRKIVRILKNIRNVLAENAVPGAGDMPSFFIESLSYNAADGAFAGATYTEELRSVLQDLWTKMNEAGVEARFREVSELKLLFHGEHTLGRAKAFVSAAWTHVGF